MIDSFSSKLAKPYPGEIWYIKNEEITLDHERLIPIPNRACLILSSENAIKECQSTVNIIPLSAKGSVDKFRFPVGAGIEDCIEKFEKKDESKALLHLYQAISRDHLDKRIARLELNTYLAVKYCLCVEVIGFENVSIS